MCEPRPQEPVDGGNKASDHSSREKRGKETGENDDTTPGPERAEGRVIIKYMKFAKAVTSMGLGRAWENAPLVRVSGPLHSTVSDFLHDFFYGIEFVLACDGCLTLCL